MKRIVFVIRQLRGGGAERVTASLANEISKIAGYEAHIITFSYDKEKDYPVEEKVFVHTIKVSQGNRISGIYSRLIGLRHTIGKLDPYCVISLEGPRAATLLALAMSAKKTPLILSERNDPERYPESKLLRCMRLYAYMCSDGLVFQTHGAQKYFPRFISSKGVVIRNPISESMPERFAGTRKPRIVNFCRLIPQKNLSLLIESFANITGEFPEYSLHIYGDGPEKNVLEAKIKQLRLSDRILLHGYTNQIYTEVVNSALFVSSSDYEGISNAMLEAISMGIPSICTDCPPGGARETISNGVNGILVPTGDSVQMSKAMRQVLSDPFLADTMSKAGSQLREELGVKTIATQWLSFVEQIAEKQ